MAKTQYIMRKIFFTCSILFFSTLFFIACEDKDNEKVTNTGGGGTTTPADSTNNQITNKWIYDEMSVWYYWNDKIGKEANLNFTLDPDIENGFFESILYTQTKANGATLGTKATYDKFSWIEAYTTNSKAATSTDIGFDFIPLLVSEGSNQVVLVVSYVKPRTWASQNGIKRGFIISKVNNVLITRSNWSAVLFQNQPTYDLTYAPNAVSFSKNSFSEITLQRTTNYEDKPLMMDSIYTVGSHKIGYMVFNTYGTEGDVNDLSDNRYLIQRISALKDQGITDLVLDLRYNGGGLVTTGVHLGSALVPDRDSKNIYEVKKYNDLIQGELDKKSDGDPVKESYVADRFRDKIKWGSVEYDEIPRLGDQLQTLCIIGTGYTASCSEMTINCLKPYYKQAGKNLYVIGEETVGKNVGSWTITPEDTRIKWQIQPITFQSFNIDNSSDYFSGFTPDESADDFADLGSGLKELGDKDETLLAAAIAKITGTQVKTTTKSTHSLLFSPLSRAQLEKGGRRFDMIVSQKEVNELKSKSAAVFNK